jgi:gliding motility-associated-like protein
MRKIYFLSTLVLTLLIGNISSAQDFSNKGKEFWLCFPQHVPSGANLATLSIWITSDKASSGTVTMTNGAFSAPFSILANGLQEIQIPHATGHISNAESGLIIQKSIRIKTDPGKPAVVAYAQQWGAARSAATLLLPTNVLGKRYYATSFTQVGTSQGSYVAKSQFQIIATKANTLVRITPRTNGTLGTVFTVALPNVGDMYQYQADQDLTGSLIESVAAAGGGCLPIAVFSGSSAITFGTNTCGGGSSFDPLFQQQYPISTWGKNFGFVPFGDYINGNPYRVLASEDNTNVYFDGLLVATLNEGQIYPATFNSSPVVLTVPTSITADKPIAVIQYAMRQNCSGSGFGDPDMVLLNPIEQNISDITIFSSSQQAISRQWVNVLIKTVATPSFRISFNGGPLTPPTGTWLDFTPLPGYSYLRQLLGAPGSYRLVADSGYNAIAYGFSANFESYAYSAGTNVKDLYQQIGVSTQYGIEPTPSVCKGSPFRFKVSLPYCADSIRWDLSLLPGPPVPGIILTQYTSCSPPPTPGGPDSTTVVNGVTLYWYSLPALYSFNVSGTFPVSMTVYKPNTDGCGSEQEIDFDLSVFDPPFADFDFVVGGCAVEQVQFFDATTTPRPSYIWNWDFGDPASGAANISGLKNPTHTFSGPGTYNVTFSTITTPGCISAQIMKQVTVVPLPSASISGNTAVCLNASGPDITFTATDGTAPYTFTYNINGGPNLTINTIAGNTVTVSVPTNAAGTFTYNLVSVKNTSSILCSQAQTGSATVIVNPLPTASIAGGITVCRNAASPLVTFTGAVGQAPFTFTYNINGGPDQNITTVIGNSVTVPAPTTTAGVFTYNLVSVTDASSTICSQVQTGTTTITVNELPTAFIAGTTEVCRNAASPFVTFTGAGTSAPYTFTYNINGGPNLTITTVIGNSVSLAVPTGAAGTFTYNLVSVVDATSALCSQAQTGAATVIVNPLPTAGIAGNTAVCVNAPSPDITFTGATGVAPYTFMYNINGGPNQSVTTISGNSVTVPVPTTVAGTFTYNLVSVQSSGPVSCLQSQTGSVAVTVNPLPTASISGTITVCKNAPSPNVTFTGGAATAPYTFTYTVNGGPNLTLTTTIGNSITVAAPTTTAGTFTYNLVSVQEASSTLCSQPQSGTVIVTVNDLPTASIAGTTEVCVNAPSPAVTFTGAGTSAPYTFTYTINGGPNLTVSTVSGNTVSIPVPTAAAGTFTYNLISVLDGTATLCSQAQTGSAVVTVNPLPTSNFSFIIPSCETRVIGFNDLSTPNVGALTTWAWNFGDPGSGANNIAALQNPSHTFAAAGAYTVSLSVTNDKGCISNPVTSIPVTINNRPESGFMVPEVCINDAATVFTDTSKIAVGTIDPAGYFWNFGDPGSGAANFATTMNGSHLYTAIGLYNVMHVVTSALGCKDTVYHDIFINAADPVSDFTISNLAGLCSNDSVSLVNKSTISQGSVTKLEIYWDVVGAPLAFDVIDVPVFNGVYKHKYPTLQTPANYTIRIIAYSGAICFTNRTAIVTVNAAPRVQFNNMPDACLDAVPFQITQASEVGGVAGPPGVFSGPGVSATGIFNPALTGPGTYTIKYKFTSNFGCADSLSKTITVLDSASAQFTYSTLNCENSPVSFNSSTSTIPAASGTITGWTWDFGDPASGVNNTSTSQNPSHTFTGWGNYNVRLFVTTSNGCRSTVRTVPVFVNPVPRPNFTFPATACLPSANIVFNSSTSSIPDGTEPTFTYLWNFGDPGSGALNTSTGSGPSHIYNSAGPFSVSLQITSGAGCTSSITIPVNSIHPEPKGSFTVDKTDVCVGAGSFTFTDNSDPMDGITTQWNWNMDDGNTRNTSSVNYTFSTPKTYNVSLFTVNSFGCRSTTFTLPVTVHPYPVVDAGPDRIILEGGQISLEPIVTGNDLTYLWTPALPGYFAGSNAIKNPFINGIDDITLTLTVTGRGGCKDDDQVFIKVLKFPTIPNIFSPNGDGVHDKWVIDYLNTYPGSTVDIYNRYGQLIFHSDGYNVPWDGTINGKPVPVGTYYYIVNPKNGRKIMSGYVDVIR